MEYIEREAFLADKKWLYCTDCDKRKGKKRGKMVTLYEIGEAPCKSCGIHDMLEEVEVYPAADVAPVVRCKDCKHSYEEWCGYEDLCVRVCSYGVSVDCVVPDDFFCADGAKMDKEETE